MYIPPRKSKITTDWRPSEKAYAHGNAFVFYSVVEKDSLIASLRQWVRVTRAKSPPTGDPARRPIHSFKA